MPGTKINVPIHISVEDLAKELQKSKIQIEKEIRKAFNSNIEQQKKLESVKQAQAKTKKAEAAAQKEMNRALKEQANTELKLLRAEEARLLVIKRGIDAQFLQTNATNAASLASSRAIIAADIAKNQAAITAANLANTAATVARKKSQDERAEELTRIGREKEARLKEASDLTNIRKRQLIEGQKSAPSPTDLAAKELKKMSRVVSRSFGQMHGAFQSMIGRIGGIIRRVAFWGTIIGSGVGIGAVKLIGILRDFEATRLSLTSMLTRLSRDGAGPFTNFKETNQFSGALLELIEKKAIETPATSEDIQEALLRVAPAVANVGGLSTRDIVNLSQDVATSERLGRLKTGTVGQDVRQILTGQIRDLGVQEPLLRKFIEPFKALHKQLKDLKSSGASPKAIQDKKSEIFAKVRFALTIGAETKEAVTNSFEGLLTTLQDKGRIFARTVFRPVFEVILKDMKIWNALIDNSQEGMSKLANVLSEKVLSAYFDIKEMVISIKEGWRDVWNLIKAFIALWGSAQIIGIASSLLSIFRGMHEAWIGIRAAMAASLVIQASSGVGAGFLGFGAGAGAGAGIAGALTGASALIGSIPLIPVILGVLATGGIAFLLHSLFSDSDGPDSSKQVLEIQNRLAKERAEAQKVLARKLDEPFIGDNSSITVNIDAAGSSIVVYQTLNTDNPVRVAGAALEAAYQGVIQGSSATGGFGSLEFVP